MPRRFIELQRKKVFHTDYGEQCQTQSAMLKLYQFLHNQNRFSISCSIVALVELIRFVKNGLSLENPFPSSMKLISVVPVNDEHQTQISEFLNKNFGALTLFVNASRTVSQKQTVAVGIIGIRDLGFHIQHNRCSRASVCFLPGLQHSCLQKALGFNCELTEQSKIILSGLSVNCRFYFH